MKRVVRLRRALVGATRNFSRDNCLDQAAAVSFYSLLSLGPLLYLAVATLSRVFRGVDVSQVTLDRVSRLWPVEAAAALERVAAGLQSSPGLVIVALPALFWTGTSALTALQYAVGVAFGEKERHTIWRTRLTALAILAVGWGLLGASLIASTLLPVWKRIRDDLGIPVAPSGVIEFFSAVMVVVSAFVVLTLLFKALPRAKVTWGAAVGGAVLALVFGEGARRLFGTLLVHSPALGLLSGTLAGVVTFLLWIYTEVAIFLLAAELAALLNGSRGDAPGGPDPA